MRTPSGELHVVDFKTEQIVASIQPTDYWDDKRHWEIKNNIDTLEFRVFDNTRHSSTLMQQNLVLKEVRDGRIVPYVITEIEKNSDDRSVIAYASGEWIQLAKAGIIPPQKLEGKTVIEMMDIALAGTKWQKGNLEYASFRSMTIDEFIDPLSFLKKIASLFELEIQYRAEVVGSQIVGRYIDMVKKRGQETGKEITLGKDLLGIKRIENSQNICTALLGFVKKEGGEFVTITEINGGVPYLVDSDAFQRWNEKGQHKFGFYSPETENEDMDSKRLMTLMNTELKKRVNSSVFYEVEAQSIGRVFGLVHELINDGDTIRIKDTGFTPKLYLEARAIAGDESFKNPLQDKYVFGDYHEIVDPNEELRKIYNRILSSLGNKANKELLEQLEKLTEEAKNTAINAKKESEAAKTLAEKVQENIKNNTVEIIESKNPPTTGLKDRKTLWLDISNGKPGILKLWKDGIWDPVVPDVEKAKKETLEQVSKDIESTKTELNQKVQEAQNQATGQFNEVKESLQGVSRTISDVQKEQGNINKKVTQIEQTADGFKTSIESLTKKDNDISNKLNTVEQTVEGTKKTISDVQQTTNDLKKTTTDIKEEAGKISEKLTSVETKVNNAKIGGRNVVLGTSIPASVIGNNTANQTVNIYNFAGGDSSSILNKETCVSFDWKVEGTTTPSGTMYMQGSNPYPLIAAKITFSPQNLSGKYLGVITISGSAFKSINMRLDNFTTGAKIIVSNFQIEIGNKATEWTPAPEDQVTTDEFTKKTTEIEKSVGGIKETITKVENNQSGFDKRVTEVEKTANGITQNVSKLQETQTQQGKTLTQATTTLEQHSEALNLTMKKKDVEDYVGGLGAINEIRDAGFTQGNKYWGWSNGHAIDPNLKYKGYNSFSMHTTGQDQDRWWGAFGQFIDCSPSEDIVISAYFNTDGKVPIDNGVYIEMEFWQSNKATRISTARERVQIINNTWIRSTCTAKAPAGTGFVRFRPYIQRNGRAWFCMPMLQRGKVATEFWLHPKDQTDADKMLEDIANRVATEQYNQKMTQIDNRFSVNEKGIDLAAKKTEVYTKIQADGQFAKDSYVRDLEGRIQITERNILSTVKKGDIISSINQTAEAVKINAGRIELDGTTIAKYLEAQELKGTTIRTDNGVNYVHIQKQFIRLMESNISRVYLGYYKDRTSQIQPTVVLGGDSDFQDGSVVLSKQPTQGFLGVINGKDSNGEPYFVSSVVFKRSGELNLNAGMNGNVTVKAGIGINHYAQGGSYWVEATGGIGLKGGNKNVLIDSRTAIIFSLKDKNMLDVVDYNGDTDLRFQTLTLRNGPSSYAGKLQVKSGSGTSFSPVVASNFETSSQRKYKTNIRDVQFSALEKIMALNIQQYNLKTDMEQLYEMRMNRQDNDPVLTTNDIQTRYGWIADDESNPECFVTKEKNAAEIYSSIALQIKAFQEEKLTKDAEIEELKEENKQMNRRIEVLEQLLVQNLIDKKPEQL
ncbi:phage tail spike protein [Bacillus wiedmannii]|uniref:phage tail spike protein n=2 Tax=Bacillus wiedmannii TaxID=1890302 RepID=UPI0021CF3A43|nr:phage tail spike protein [Bacillus wiedmannii]MCU5601025.1 tail fiber domain-containing protein [Bacillus wiedmannii]